MNKKLFTILGLALLILSSCKDYLEVDTPSEFDKTYVFSSVTDTKKALLGVYSLFGEDAFTSRMSSVWMQNTDVEAMQPSANPDGSRRDVWSLEGAGLAGFSDVYKAWNNNYLAIDRANQCVEGILSSDIVDDPDMQMLLGEAYCLKAFRYYLLCNFWSDVPYFSEAAKAGMELDIPRTDKNYIYTECIKDLVGIEENMYFADEYADGTERMNREFAIGMIARLALFRAGYGMTVDGTMKRADDYMDVAGDEGLAVTYTYNGSEKTARTSTEYYQLASDYCKKLIALKDRDLNPDFKDIFYQQCLPSASPANDDVLYEVAFLAENGGDVGWCVGTNVFGGSKGTSTVQVNLTPSYYFSFDDDDTRRDVTISKVAYTSDTEQEMSGITGLATGKWNRLWLTTDPGANSSKGTGINWPLMRYSDVLLMLAEAENEVNGGPTGDAIEALKRVRRRAFPSDVQGEKVDNYVASLSSKEDFFDAIVDERAWEFGGEALRKFDLVRWNIYGEKIVETMETINNMGKAAYEIDLTDPDVAQYADLAQKLYYRVVDGTIVFLNTKYNPDEVPENVVPVEELDEEGNEDAYAAQNWARSLYKYEDDEATGERIYMQSDYVTRSWRGYTDATGQSAVPYLLPISNQTVGASDYLNNNGYLLN